MIWLLGLVTFVIAIDADNRGYGFASRENGNVDLRPTLDLDYTVLPIITPTPEPGTLALLGLGGIGADHPAPQGVTSAR